MVLVRLLPVSKDYLWGGTKLKEDYNKKTDFDIVAESRELSTYKDGQSIMDSGGYKGLTLSEHVEKLGRDVLGTERSASEFSPTLIKFIDAKGDLSIQVHPNNEYVLRVEKGYGKIEVWYILNTGEGASLYYGTNKEITKDEFRARIEDNTILDILKKVLVHKGGVFFIKPGTIYAIGEGIVICEIRQNSSTTYHVYDFGRIGKDGKPRELYIEKAIDVSNLTPLENDFKPIGEEKDYGTHKCAMMATCEYFTTYVYDAKAECSVKMDEKGSAPFVIVDGEGSIESDDTMLNIRKGDSVFASVDTGKVAIRGSCRFILSKV